MFNLVNYIKDKRKIKMYNRMLDDAMMTYNYISNVNIDHKVLDAIMRQRGFKTKDKYSTIRAWGCITYIGLDNHRFIMRVSRVNGFLDGEIISYDVQGIAYL